MEFFDSHCHLDPMRFGGDLPDVLARARAAGVTGMTVIGTRAADSEAAADLAGREPGIACAAGIHPNDVHEAEPDEWDRVTRLVASGRVHAVGETGLDWYRDTAPRDLQRDFFARHMRLAQKAGLPLVVHTRDSLRDVLDMLREAFGGGTFPVVLHSFTGTAAEAAAGGRKVLAVVTCDSYADLKKQFGWLGAQVGQPGLTGMLESVLLMATQGRGLGGFDMKRPLGVVVTTDGGDLAVHGFVPVKSLDKLLESLQAVTGPTRRAGDTRSLVLPNGIGLDAVEKDGWAIIAPQGSPDAAAGLEKALDPVVDAFSLGVQVFPARMPEGMRKQLGAVLEQAAAMQQQSQTVKNMAQAPTGGQNALTDVMNMFSGYGSPSAVEV